jgi:heme oxygenase
MQFEIASSGVVAVHDGRAASRRMVALRRETRAAHARIELALPVLDVDLTRARYRRIVEALHGYYVGLEPLVDAKPMSSKVALLVDDLLALGHAASDIAGLPRCVELPQITTASCMLGARYVIEGATLGGQLIGRRLAQTLDLDATNGAAFFIGYSEHTREMWLKFNHCVESAPEFDVIAAVAAANATFETLERWLVTSLADS